MPAGGTPDVIASESLTCARMPILRAIATKMLGPVVIGQTCGVEMPILKHFGSVAGL